MNKYNKCGNCYTIKSCNLILNCLHTILIWNRVSWWTGHNYKNVQSAMETCHSNNKKPPKKFSV